VLLLRTFSKVYGLCGLARRLIAHRHAGGGTPPRCSTRSASRFFCNALARLLLVEALAHHDAVIVNRPALIDPGRSPSAFLRR